MIYTKRDKSWTKIHTGLWIDPAGFKHIFPDEVCAELGWPYTKENYDLIVGTFNEMTAALGLQVRLQELKHERPEEA